MEKAKIVMGTWAWGDDGTFGKKYPTKQLKEAFNEAVKNGFTTWDTSFNYGFGQSEKNLAECLKDVDRDKLTISDKVTPQLYEWRNDIFDAPEKLPATLIDLSLKNLKTDHIDVYWVHAPMYLEEILPQLKPLVDSGKIKSIGLSNFSIDEIESAQKILGQYGLKASAVQNHFSLLNRSSETSGLLDYCKKNDMDFWGYMPLEQGALTGKFGVGKPLPESLRGNLFNDRLADLDVMNAALGKVAEKHNTSISSIAIAYAINKGVIPVVGITNAKYVKDAKDAENLKLSENEIKFLEETAKQFELSVGSWEKEMEPSENIQNVNQEASQKTEKTNSETEKEDDKQKENKTEDLPEEEKIIAPEEPFIVGDKTANNTEKLKNEYDLMLGMYLDELDQLNDKSKMLLENKISYDEYKKYADYVVGRYNYMKEIYKQINENEKDGANKETKNENLDNKKQEETEQEKKDNIEDTTKKDSTTQNNNNNTTQNDKENTSNAAKSKEKMKIYYDAQNNVYLYEENNERKSMPVNNQYFKKGKNKKNLMKMFGDKFESLFSGATAKAYKKCDPHVVSILYNTLGINACRDYLLEVSQGKKAKKDNLSCSITYDLSGMNGSSKLGLFDRVRISRMANKHKEVASVISKLSKKELAERQNKLLTSGQNIENEKINNAKNDFSDRLKNFTPVEKTESQNQTPNKEQNKDKGDR